MHIAVEATRLLKERRGIGRYVRNLLRTFPLVDPQVRYTLYAKPRDVDGLREQIRSIPNVGERSDVRAIAELADSTADLSWYAWNWILHPTRRIPMVVTIMDLVPMQQFDHRWWKFMKRRKARQRSMRTVQRASGILTISEFTAREVHRLLGVPMDHMRVTLLAADDFDVAPAGHSETLERLDIDGPFFLAVGAQEARKNLQVLFRAMQLLHERGTRVPLVLCGPGANLEGLARNNAAEWLRYAGFVSDVELATLYQRTAGLVFPSRYEGFGLPVLEAMAAGAPVACARASSLPEVAGNAALYFDPDDHVALADVMTTLLTDANVVAGLRAAMTEQVARFSWLGCARETLAGFAAAVGSPRGSAIQR